MTGTVAAWLSVLVPMCTSHGRSNRVSRSPLSTHDTKVDLRRSLRGRVYVSFASPSHIWGANAKLERCSRSPSAPRHQLYDGPRNAGTARRHPLPESRTATTRCVSRSWYSVSALSCHELSVVPHGSAIDAGTSMGRVCCGLLFQRPLLTRCEWILRF